LRGIDIKIQLELTKSLRTIIDFVAVELKVTTAKGSLDLVVVVVVVVDFDFDFVQLLH